MTCSHLKCQEGMPTAGNLNFNIDRCSHSHYLTLVTIEVKQKIFSKSITYPIKFLLLNFSKLMI